MWRKKKIEYLGDKKRVFLDQQCELGNNTLFDTRGGMIRIGKSYINGNSKFHTTHGNITIGDNVTIGDYSYISSGNNVVIEDNVLFADKVNIIGAEHTYLDINVPIRAQESVGKEIKIGSGSWIGINVTILGNTEIGKNCVIGANSVVKGKFPDYCVIAGNPARIVKQYKEDRWVKYGEL